MAAHGVLPRRRFNRLHYRQRAFASGRPKRARPRSRPADDWYSFTVAFNVPSSGREVRFNHRQSSAFGIIPGAATRPRRLERLLSAVFLVFAVVVVLRGAASSSCRKHAQVRRRVLLTSSTSGWARGRRRWVGEWPDIRPPLNPRRCPLVSLISSCSRSSFARGNAAQTAERDA